MRASWDSCLTEATVVDAHETQKEEQFFDESEEQETKDTRIQDQGAQK